MNTFRLVCSLVDHKLGYRRKWVVHVYAAWLNNLQHKTKGD